MNNQPISCSTNMCLYLKYESHCSVHEVLHIRPILRDCPCKQCVIRPICKKRCKNRVGYMEYLVEHLYEESKARTLIRLGRELSIETAEPILLRADHSTYDITLRK